MRLEIEKKSFQYVRMGANNKTGASGTSKRFVRKDGRIYGHILDPRIGWPVIDSPLSVTVATPTCSEAGKWATLAKLQGKYAEYFLENESDRKHWMQR